MTRVILIRTRWYALVPALVLTAGCGPATSTVSGVVSLDGTLVPEGTVSFLMEDGTVQSSFIMKDGTYHLDAVPVGKAKITVLTKSAGAETMAEDIKNQGKTGAVPKVEGPKVIIPVRYASPDTSGLTCEVKGKETTYDIPLTTK
jgi:hypothetical protein